MNFPAENLDFQRKILLDQREKILSQFKDATFQWAEQQKAINKQFREAKRAFDDADIQTLRLSKVTEQKEYDLLLQQLNFQRAWIDTKLKNLEAEEGHILTNPVKDQLQVQQLALETAFLEDFPVIGKKFLKRLKKLLKKNAMTVQSNFGAFTGRDGLPKPSFNLKKAVRKVTAQNSTPTKTCKQLEIFIRNHPGVDRLRNGNGDFDSPNFSKEAVEELVGHSVSFMTLSKIQISLQKYRKDIKKRKRKSERRLGMILQRYRMYPDI